MSEQKTVQDAALEVAGSLVVAFRDIEDPRGRQGKRHVHSDVLTIAVLGCLCGCDDAEALEDWARKEEPWLKEFLALRWGVPSQDTFLRVLAQIDQREFRRAFLFWIRRAFPKAVGGQIAIDGKTARRSGDKEAEKKAVHMVSALACEYGLILGQEATESKSCELEALRVLIRLLELKGAMVSMDALGCQCDVAQSIVDQGGDYLLALKKNQPLLHEQVNEAFAALLLPPTRNVDRLGPPPHESWCDTDAGHGRIETRTTTVIHQFDDWIPVRERWKGLTTLVRVHSERFDESDETTTTETRFYISSRRLSAQQAHEHVRAHWLVENGLHHVLDVSFGEDNCMVRKNNAAANFIVVRHFAVSLIRSYAGDKLSVPRRRRLCDYRVGYREELLAAVAM